MSNYRRLFVENASYFFTVALADRRQTLLTDHITGLRRAYQRVLRQHPFETVAICVLPDHMHAIWTLPEGDTDYPLRWRLIKQYFSHALHLEMPRSASKIKHREKGIWQRRYWEHVIRSQEEMEKCIDYIHYNPVKHGWVSRCADWEYSSFHRYVLEGILSPDWGIDVEYEFGNENP
ncbi:putative transposase [Neisseria sp. HSC-16F19]|nr:transposase [Neisseria sp. HSC-16F19]MCP2040057.1 putative transposase [Neisseria sp. HSC-16F19]